MTDKVTKLLAKLPPKQLKTILDVLEQIQSGSVEALDIKMLKGHTGIYRVRVGNYRIILSAVQDKYKVLLIAKRNEKTYRDF